MQTGKQALLLWCQKNTDGYRGVDVKNFSASWRDGLAFCALVDHFHPGSIGDFNSLDPNSPLINHKLAFDAAESVGVSPLLEPEDMLVGPRPEQFSVMTYLSGMYHVFSKSGGRGGIANISVDSSGSGQSIKGNQVKTTTTTSNTTPQSKHTNVAPKVTQTPTPVKKDVPPCEKCGSPLHGNTVSWSSKIYHQNCFGCTTCGKKFTEACLNVEDKPYCDDCGKIVYMENMKSKRNNRLSGTMDQSRDQNITTKPNVNNRMVSSSGSVNRNRLGSVLETNKPINNDTNRNRFGSVLETNKPIQNDNTNVSPGNRNRLGSVLETNKPINNDNTNRNRFGSVLETNKPIQNNNTNVSPGNRNRLGSVLETNKPVQNDNSEKIEREKQEQERREKLKQEREQKLNDQKRELEEKEKRERDERQQREQRDLAQQREKEQREREEREKQQTEQIQRENEIRAQREKEQREKQLNEQREKQLQLEKQKENDRLERLEANRERQEKEQQALNLKAQQIKVEKEQALLREKEQREKELERQQREIDIQTNQANTSDTSNGNHELSAIEQQRQERERRKQEREERQRNLSERQSRLTQSLHLSHPDPKDDFDFPDQEIKKVAPPRPSTSVPEIPDMEFDEDTLIRKLEKKRVTVSRNFNINEYLENQSLRGNLKVQDFTVLFRPFVRKWFVLEKTKLLFYASSKIQTYPEGVISFEYSLDIEPFSTKKFKIVLPEAEYVLEASTVEERDSWVSGLREAKEIYSALETISSNDHTSFVIEKDDLRKEGQLYRKTGKSWKSMRTIVVGGLLYTYTQRGKRKDKIALYGSKWELVEDRALFAWKINTIDHKTIILGSEDEMEMHEWLNTLRKQTLLIEETIDSITF